MNPFASPYSLPTISTPRSGNALAGWQFQPYQMNSSGTLPGTTTIGINGQGVQISGPNSSIVLSDPTSQQTTISILGQKGYILFTNPNTKVNQGIVGFLPDGTEALVFSKTGVDVLSIFS